VGEALAIRAAEEGASHVAAIDRNGPEAGRVATAVGGTAFGIDVRDEDALRRAVGQTEAAHGPIALFCSNAGVLGDGGVEEPTQRIRQLCDTHVMAHVYGARAVLPSMIRNAQDLLGDERLRKNQEALLGHGLEAQAGDPRSQYSDQCSRAAGHFLC
jgi:NAD(P)-dependent dehydrogenase (short-subunit alcohol dehydrogenase family)